MSLTKKRIESKARKLGWEARFGIQKNWSSGKSDKYVEFLGVSPRGEELVFTEFYQVLGDIPVLLFERYNDFDKDEHVLSLLEAKRNGFGGVPGVCELADDAKEIEQMILELSAMLNPT